MEKNLFIIGITLSLLAHAVSLVLLSLPYSGTRGSSKEFKSIEVTYQDLKLQGEENGKALFKDLKVIKDPKSYDDQKLRVLDKKKNMFSTIGDRIKDISKLTGKLRTSQKKTHKITTLDLAKKITLPPLSTEKITNPKYLTYNDDMRDTISRNIKQRAYAYVNHPDFEAGEVYLTFMLASDGMLKGVKIIDEKTSANDYLREVALRSIKESNPFPPFPEGFDYPEFTFNLLISFQN
ncbi:MAG: TonB C-terminal domain-containing protein [Candidatus Omnitrophica bacterium]|nr:TonB C-terminal domain-containing protein [Candidatus Omnitrophota bacterium]MCK5260154.1 TonB C-terminal domain-containing protein [Candidatus Omnitrophota bacterium]